MLGPATAEAAAETALTRGGLASAWVLGMRALRVRFTLCRATFLRGVGVGKRAGDDSNR